MASLRDTSFFVAALGASRLSWESLVCFNVAATCIKRLLRALRYSNNNVFVLCSALFSSTFHLHIKICIELKRDPFVPPPL